MTQVGSLSPVSPGPIIFEDDFETYQSGVLLPQCSTDPTNTVVPAGTCVGDDPLTPVDEDNCKPANKGICLNYWPTGSAKATNKEFKFGGQSLLVNDPANTGLVNAITSKPIPVNGGSQYVFTAWLNTKDLQGTGTGALNRLVAQVVDSASNILATATQEESNGWTKYIIPTNPNPATNSVSIRVYMENMAVSNPIKASSKSYVDMLSLAPVLEIQTPTGSESYSDRSCRIYAKPDALSCKYRERNTGREIQGWRGFCAESDPKNPEYCLQWWPIDLISGEDIGKF